MTFKIESSNNDNIQAQISEKIKTSAQVQTRQLCGWDRGSKFKFEHHFNTKVMTRETTVHKPQRDQLYQIIN